MSPLALEERLNACADPHQQMQEALQIILESPNGEYKSVFGYLSKEAPDVNSSLATRISPFTGLMQPRYFSTVVDKELRAADYMREHQGVNVQGLYAILIPENVQDAKEHLKTNEFARTSVIGDFGTHIAVYFEADTLDANAALAELGAYAVVECQPGKSFAAVHREARAELLASARLPYVVEFSRTGDMPNLRKYWEIKRALNH